MSKKFSLGLGRITGKETVRSSVVFMLFCFISSMLAMTILLPELLLFHRSFMYPHDLEIPYENTYTLVSQFFHGGIQLWDREDQTNFAFYHLSSGVYTLVNIITAGFYILFSWLSNYPGELFHRFYTWGFYGLTTLIRTFGGYLLLRKFCQRKWVIWVSLIYLNTLLSGAMWNGISTNNINCYLPLMLYFVLNFFESFRLRDFLSAVLVMTIAIFNAPLFALGYFYLPVHLFMFSCIVFRPIYRGDNEGFLPALRRGGNARNFGKITVVCLLSAVIFLPLVSLAKTLKTDYFMAESGIGDTRGRINNCFSVSGYFKGDIGEYYTKPKEFLVRAVSYFDNEWAGSWTFNGISTLLFALLGLVFSKFRQKWIFFLTIVLLFLVNIPKNMYSPFSVGHWIVVLTNPFSFLLRSFHMPAMLMPVFFLPLIAFGLDAIADLAEQRFDTTKAQRLPGALILLLGAVLVLAYYLDFTARVYSLFGTTILLLILYAYWPEGILGRVFFGQISPRVRKAIVFVLLGIVFLVDLNAFSIYIRTDAYSKKVIAARKYTGLSTSSPIILDYQNPIVLPFQEYFHAEENLVEPRVFSIQNSFGLFYHFTSLNRYFIERDVFTPCPKSYKNLPGDKNAQQSLQRNKHLLKFVNFAVDDSVVPFEKIVKAGLDNQVVAVQKGQPAGPNLLPQLPAGSELTPEVEPNPPRALEFSFPFRQARKHTVGAFTEYSFDLPKTFPDYFATTVFTQDHDRFELAIAGQKLEEVQGKLLSAFSYDVQNIKKGELRVLMPREYASQDQVAVLKVKPYSNITEIWRNQADNFGFTYQAPHSGWLIFHFPYDKKWQLNVDGRKQEIFVANNYFFTTPLEKGVHRILLQYWPETHLREMIEISMLLTVLIFFVVVFIGFRYEQMNAR